MVWCVRDAVGLVSPHPTNNEALLRCSIASVIVILAFDEDLLPSVAANPRAQCVRAAHAQARVYAARRAAILTHTHVHLLMWFGRFAVGVVVFGGGDAHWCARGVWVRFPTASTRKKYGLILVCIIRQEFL